MRAILSYASLSTLDLPLGTVLHALHPLASGVLETAEVFLALVR